MSAAMQQFHFLQPWWLAALALLPLLWWLGARRRRANAELSRLVDADLLPHLLYGRPGSRHLPVWLFMAGWMLATLAMAGPTWSRVAQPLYASRAAQVVAISLSRHMLARDVAPSRLDRAIYKAHQLLDSNHDGLNALIGYAGEAFVVAPLTSDANSLSDLLNAMAPDTMPVDGNNAALAIKRAVKLIHDAHVKTGSLVLITDQADAAAIAAARQAAAAGLKVSVLGVGTAQGGPIAEPGGGFLHDKQGHMVMAGRDDAALSALAAAGGGRYVPMTNDQRDVEALHSQLRIGSTRIAKGQLSEQWQDRGPWLLLPLLVLVALSFRRGWLLLLALMVLPAWPGRAEATSWRDLWQRPDQQAAQALQHGAVKQAQQLARDPAWRGVADYRAGDFAAAAKTLRQVSGTDGAYNLGNALARQGQYPQAIKAYDQALKRDPANADAIANRKAVENWLHRQQQKKQSAKQPSSNSQKQKGKGGSQKPSSGSDKSGKQGKPGQSSEQGGSPKNGNNPSGDQAKSAPGGGKNQGDQDQAGDQPKPQTPQQQAEQKARAQKAQEALKQQMDKAMAGLGKGHKASPPPTHQLGVMAKGDPQSKLPADLRQALQRVPDDPGALLRRKFALEYLQRHGGVPPEDQQP